MPYLLLCVSVLFTAGRNLVTKKLSSVAFGTREFFIRQTVLALSGAVIIFIIGGIDRPPSLGTLLFSALYSALLVLAQWFYTSALSGGNVALCATVYSMGFIIPTLVGAIFWQEAFQLLDGVGVALAVSTVLLSGLAKGDGQPALKRAEQKGENEGEKAEITKENSTRLPSFALFIAMLASGALGVLQKCRPVIEGEEQSSLALPFAFLFASLVSLLAALFAKPSPDGKKDSPLLLFIASPLVGLFFGCCNMINTHLAATLPSSLFFPVLNIGVIFATTLLGALIYRERPKLLEYISLLLGVGSILMLSF